MFKYFVGAFLALVLSFSVQAAPDRLGSVLSCPTDVETLFEPLSQRVLLAMFGKDAALAALSHKNLTESQISTIESLTSGEASACASPMPAYTSTAVISILHYLYWVTLIMWIVIIVAYSFDSSYLSMGRNNDRAASEESPLLKIVRAAIAMLFTAPLMSLLLSNDEDNNESLEYSSIHKLMFMAIGKSVGTSEAINESLSQTHIPSNPIYSLPEPDYALKSGSFQLLSDVGAGAMMNFAMCAIASNQNRAVYDTDLVINSEKTTAEKHVVEITLKNPDADCYVKLEMPSDLSTISLSKSLAEKHQYNLIDYKRLEQQTFANLVQDLLFSSLGMAAGMLGHVGEATDLAHSKVSQHEDLTNLKYWTQLCPIGYDESFSFGSKYSLNSEGELTENSFYTFQMLAERCLSYTIVAKLGYPKHPSGDTVANPNSEIGNTLLKYDAAELTKVDENGNNAYVFPELDYMRKLDGRQYQACSYSREDSGYKIKECTESVCDAANAADNVSGIFECALMINKAGKERLTNFYSSLGFIATPATMMTTIGSSSVPESPQQLLKNFAIESQITIANGVIGQSFYGKTDDIKNEKNVLIFPPSFVFTDYKVEANSTNKDQYSNILTCLINPSSLVQIGEREVVCEHPLNEIHNISVTLLKMYAGFSLGVVGAMIAPISAKKLKDRDDTNKKSKGDGYLADEVKESAPSLAKPTAAQANSESQKSSKGFRKILDTVAPYIGLGFIGLLAPMLLDGEADAPSFFLSFLFDDGENPYWNDSRGSLSGMGIIASLTLGYLVSGDIRISGDSKNSNEESAAISKKARNVTLIGTTMLILGFVGAFIIPLAPLAIFYAGLFSILANILANILSANFQVIYALASTGKDIRTKLTSMFNKWLLLVLRLPLMVVGYYMAMSLMLTILPDFAMSMNDIVDRAELSRFNDNMLMDIVKWLIGLCLFLAAYFLLMFSLMDAISAPFNLTRGLIFNDDSGHVLGADDSQGKLNRNIQIFKNL